MPLDLLQYRVIEDACRQVVDGALSRAGSADPWPSLARIIEDIRGAMFEILDCIEQDVESNWKSMTNSAALPNKLSPEMLCAVFSHLDFAHRVKASHVCRQWRHVALGEVTLWTKISIMQRGTGSRLEALEALLDRTKAAAVDVSIEFRNTEWPMDIEQCIPLHMSHIQRLCLVTNSPNFHWQPIWEALSMPAPSLTSLELDGVRAGYIPPTIFEGYAPQLTRLVLGGFMVPQQCPAFRIVQSLSGSFGLDDESLAGETFPELIKLSFPLPDYPALPDVASFLPRLRTFQFGSSGPTLKADMRRRLRSETLRAIPRVIANNASNDQLKHLVRTFGQPYTVDVDLDDRARKLDITLSTANQELQLTYVSIPCAGRLITDSGTLASVDLAHFSEFAVPPYTPNTTIVAADLRCMTIRVSMRHVRAGRYSVLNPVEFQNSACVFRTPALQQLALVADARDGYLRVVETEALEQFLLRRLELRQLDELVLDGVVLERDRSGGISPVERMIRRIVPVTPT
ncbi:hypothetical protein AURDEDRAFT_167987 [Auricularia subglabra TFB-10046 SS5]|nr:hypothetical protein AURDEDRAFT_167987 [Auricularia subglabra TFB-10046 SS5]